MAIEPSRPIRIRNDDSGIRLAAESHRAHRAGTQYTPREVQEVCFGHPLVQQARSEGENPVYYVLGQTDAGSIYSASSSDSQMGKDIR